MATPIPFADEMVEMINLLFPPTDSNSDSPPRPIRPLPTRAAVSTTDQQVLDAHRPDPNAAPSGSSSTRKVLPFLHPEAKLFSLHDLLVAYRNKKYNRPSSVPLHPRVYTIRRPSSALPLPRAGTPPQSSPKAKGIFPKKIMKRPPNNLHPSPPTRLQVQPTREIRARAPTRDRTRNSLSLLFPTNIITSESSPRPVKPLPVRAALRALPITNQESSEAAALSITNQASTEEPTRLLQLHETRSVTEVASGGASSIAESEADRAPTPSETTIGEEADGVRVSLPDESSSRRARKVEQLLHPEAKLQSLNELLTAHRSRAANFPYPTPLHPRVHTVIGTPASHTSLRAGTPPRPNFEAQGYLNQIHTRTPRIPRQRSLRSTRIRPTPLTTRLSFANRGPSIFSRTFQD